jgi:hypothetical protein
MTEQELVNDIIAEITFSGSLPFKMPQKELSRIIVNAKRYFWDYWRYSLQTQHVVIPRKVFYETAFTRQRGIVMPDCVQYICECKEVKSSSIFGTIDRDFGDQKFIGSELFLTPFMGEALTYRLATFSFLDITKNLTINTVAYDYNNSTHFLQILGRTPKADLYLKVWKKIDDERLFENELFQRYVRAKAKIRTHEMLSVVGFKLPGNFTYNYSEMKSEADKEINEVQRIISDENTPDFLILENY